MDETNMPEEVKNAIKYLNDRGIDIDSPMEDTSALDSIINSADDDLDDDFDLDDGSDLDDSFDLDDDDDFEIDSDEEGSSSIDLDDDVDVDDLNSMF
ncbi:MAG: hypothetical protein E7158_05500 [Firmicutes bacterium]|nr:hypothetical protein [Bacillota bacterium]